VTIPAAEVSRALASALAAERLRIVATLIRHTGDWELAEDCVQDAAHRALTLWPERGIPDNPAAWLTTVAKNLALDALRRAATERRAGTRYAVELQIDEEERNGMTPPDVRVDDVLDDDRLRLIFTCCHPALALDARVALTLRTVVGLSVDEAAHAFLVTEATMQKRLVRARAKIKAAGIPYRVPPPELLPERVDGVLAVLYLLFTEGYSSGGGEQYLRTPLAEEAIRLTRLVVELMHELPQLPEALGLLALELFQHSRSATRVDASGDLVLIEDQDRTRWDHAAIAEGVAVLAEARRVREVAPGPYELQAQIAEQHATAPTAETTDFARIAALYERLGRLTPSPVIELNRAVAVAFSQGLDAGLVLLDSLDDDPRMAGYHLLPATRADLLRRRGDLDAAVPHYLRARDLAPSDAERRYLTRRIDAIRSTPAQ
jgi:RNA polymerase sigma-70 factor (ECF subfamily)